MAKEFETNYDAFYYMVEAATALSNSPTMDPAEDIKTLVLFIGKAYQIEDKVIDAFLQTITEKLPSIGTESDIAGFYAAEESEIKKEDRILFQTKIDAIRSLQLISEAKSPDINPSWFSYRNYLPYSPNVRLRQLRIAASNGFANINRIVGLMVYLGIGTEADKEAGIRRLLQCAYWGDVLSLCLLALAYKEAENEEKAKLFDELAGLSSYIQEGITVLPNETKTSEKAKSEFALISSIRQDIVLEEGRHAINYSFVEIMLMDSLDYRTKMDYINNYNRGSWKEVSNPTASPSKGFGFHIEEE